MHQTTLKFSMMITTFQDVREKVQRFCHVREWEVFHTPMNLMLALAGEGGELCEIFQWRGPMNNIVGNLNSQELEHLGEELSDIFIYSTRLCDVCHLDFVECMISIRDGVSCDACFTDNRWRDVSFSEFRREQKLICSSMSPRHLALRIESLIGEMCNLFGSKTETDCLPSIEKWSYDDKKNLTILLGNLGLSVICLSNMATLALEICIADKFEKNSKKYPAWKCRARNDKYTAYQTMSSGMKMTIGVTILGAFIVTFYHLLKR